MEEMKQAELVQEDTSHLVDTSHLQDSTGLQITFPGESAQKEVSIVQILAGAVKDKTQLEVIEKLIDLKNKEEDRQARKAYFKALAKFQAECPPIEKKKGAKNNDGSERYKYAELDSIKNQVQKYLSANGFSYTMKYEPSEKTKTYKEYNKYTKTTEEKTLYYIFVTCEIHHSEGHTEPTKMEVPVDNTPYMSDIQKIGSTHTYGNRYTFCGALGITSGDEDTDGNTDTHKDDPEIMKLYRFAIVGLLSLDVFSDEDKKQFKTAVKNLKTVADYKTYYEMTLQKKEKRSAELKKTLDEAVNEPQNKSPFTDKKPINPPPVMENQPQKGELFNLDSKVNTNTSDEIPEIGMEDIF
jgi:hypothetical protein